ncbi:histidine phosphatase family protein [Ferribacterium limneticum]|uniref:histidine phosphatase family protein n=1 Tax=Ferribacterium limneticum TaxID=76259 RepID=UPI001CF869FC|nr:histidine phosphatase family protein [Ferribacterium limneticum]
MRVILVRHGESKKNLIDIIGGFGDGLTVKGCLAARRVGAHLSRQVPPIEHLVFAPTVQTRQTAILIEKKLHKPKMYESPLLIPIDLGELSGLKVDEARAKYPFAMYELERWNRREIEISDVAIPGIQNISNFFCQGLQLLYSAKKSGVKSICIVATRSSLILLKNIKLRCTPEKGGNYLNSYFDYTHPVSFRLTAQDLQWIRNQLQTRLSRNGTLGRIASHRSMQLRKTAPWIVSMY